MVIFETWAGIQEAFTYITQDDLSNKLDRVIAYTYEKIINEHYETKCRKYHLSPVSKQNFGPMHYYEAYRYDFLGRVKFERDPGGNFTLHDYVYPEYTDKPVRLGESGLKAYYTNKYNKFDLPFKISKVISYKTGDDINMTPEELLYNNNCTFDDLGPEIQLVTRDTYYKYNDESRNLTAIVQKKWDSMDGTTPQ